MEQQLAQDSGLQPSVLPPVSKPVSRALTPNPRTSIRWKGKNVIICIPADEREYFGEEGNKTQLPLSKEEVQAKLKHWEELGYNIVATDGLEQVRDVYPDDGETKKQVDASEIIVSIPDKRDWEAYVNALMEERLRSLGVALDDEVSPPPQGQTPMSSLNYPHNPFSPPIPTSSALSSHMGVNAFSPIASPSPGFHFARQQSISVASPLMHGPQGDWDNQYPLYGSPSVPYGASPQQFGTSPQPYVGIPGVWTPPGMGVARGGSPAGPMSYQGLYPEDMVMPPNGDNYMFPPPHQQVRRSSPLANVGEEQEPTFTSVQEEESRLVIVEPKPKHHRSQLSISLRKEMEGTGEHSGHLETEEGLQTNPTSPAVKYPEEDGAVKYPEQPPMPTIEQDVHNDAELASNPDDDVDIEREAEERKREAQASVDNNSHYHPEQQQQQRFLSPTDFDAQDPSQNSAMAMLMASDGLGGAGRLGVLGVRDDLSDSGRTNISEIQTNPSVPPSPSRMYSTAGSQPWDEKPKFNVTAPEFKFDPGAVYNFTPSQPQYPPAAPKPQTQYQQPQTTKFGFSDTSFNVSAPTFRPSLFSETPSFGGKSFNVSAPTFTPASFAKMGGQLPDIVKPPAQKKVIPIVRPPSQEKKEEVEEEDDDRKKQGGGGKRVRGGFRSSSIDGDEVPQFALPTEQLQPMRESSAEAEAVVDTIINDNQFEFNNSQDAASFATANPTGAAPEGNAEDDSEISTLLRSSPPPTEEPTKAAEPADNKPKFNPAAKEFSFKPNPLATEFNFDFKPKSPLPKSPVFTPAADSPAGLTPGATPPVITYTSPKGFEMGSENAEHDTESDVDEDDLEPVKLPMPSQSELDEVMDLINRDDDEDELSLPTYNYRRETEDEQPLDQTRDGSISPWKRPGSRRPAIPLFETETDSPARAFNLPRSGAPSPSPRRVEHYQFDAAAFSPIRAPDQTPARPLYHSPTLNPDERRKSTAIGYNDDIDSDWNDMELPDDFSGRPMLRPQSRLFFDQHVEEFVGALLRNSLEPVEKNLASLNETLRILNLNGSTGKDRNVDSDADDEDEEPELVSPARSRSKERKRDMLRAAVTEILNKELAALPGMISEIKTVVAEAVQTFDSRLESSNAIVETLSKDVPEKLAERDMELVEEFLKEIKQELNDKVEDKLGAVVEGRWKAMLDGAFTDFSKTLKGESSSTTSAIRSSETNIVDIVSNLVADVRVQGGATNRNFKLIAEAVSGIKSLSKDEIADIIKSELAAAEIASKLQSLEGKVQAPVSKSMDWAEETENSAEVLSALEELKKSLPAILDIKKTVDSSIAPLNEQILKELRDTTERIIFGSDAMSEVVSKKINALQTSVNDALAIVAAKNDISGGKSAPADKHDLEEAIGRICRHVGGLSEGVEVAIMKRFADLQMGIKNVVSKAEIDQSVNQAVDDLIKVIGGEISGRNKDVVKGIKEVKDLVESKNNDGILHVLKVMENLKKEITESLPTDVKVLELLEVVRGEVGAAAPRSEEVLKAVEGIRQQVIASLSNEGVLEKLETVRKEILETKPQVDNTEIITSLNGGFSELAVKFAEVQQNILSKPALDPQTVSSILVNGLADIRTGLDSLQRKVSEQNFASREELVNIIDSQHNDSASTLETIVEQTLRQRDAATVEQLALLGKRVAGKEDLENSVGNVQYAIADLKKNQDSVMQELHADVKELIAAQRTAAAIPTPAPAHAHNTEELTLKVKALERMLEESTRRVEQEVKEKHMIQEKSIVLERHLQHAEEERARFKQIADEKERHLQDLADRRNQALTKAQMRATLMEGAHSSLQKAVGDLSARNVMLEGNLRAATASADKTKNDLDTATEENKELRKAIEALRGEMEESIRVREGFRRKFDRLQEDMRQAALEIANEQSRYRRIDQEQKARIELLEAKVEHERKSREPLEREIGKLKEVREESRLSRAREEQVIGMNVKLEQTLDELRAEINQHKLHEARLEAEVEAVKRAAAEELKNTVAAHEQALEAAKAEAINTGRKYEVEMLQSNNEHAHEVDTLRAETETLKAHYESELAKTKKELEEVIAKDSSAKENIKALLDEAALDKRAAIQEIREEKAEQIAELKETKIIALREAAEGKNQALAEQRRKFESQLEEITRAHDRALKNAQEDGERGQLLLKERLKIAHAQAEHLRERISLLEERVEVATSAAQAAAQAAKKHVARPSISSRDALPEKVSPQALRESIVVLQEQLQSREARIEELEAQLKDSNKNIAGKLSARDSEIAWLRELLSVRISELEEIINILQAPNFERTTLREAVVRLKANLEMELQERERHTNGSTPTLTSAVASPLAGLANKLPIAAAWGNWRKTTSVASSTSTVTNTTSAPNTNAHTNAAVSPAPQRNSSYASTFLRNLPGSRSPSETPSRPGSASGFLSGLLTPPSGQRNLPGSSANIITSTPQNQTVSQLGFGRIGGSGSGLGGLGGMSGGRGRETNFKVGKVGLGSDEEFDEDADGFADVPGDADESLWGHI